MASIPVYDKMPVSSETNILELILQSLSEGELAKAGKLWKLIKQHMMNGQGGSI